MAAAQTTTRKYAKKGVIGLPKKPRAKMVRWKLDTEIKGIPCLKGFVIGHPSIGDGEIVSSQVHKVYQTKTGEYEAETNNTIYLLY